jgi:hypothetical protein
MLPTKSDIDYLRDTGICQYARFAGRLQVRGIRLHCLSEFFLERLKGRDFCEVANPTNCYLHYTAEGYDWMADGLAAIIRHADGARTPG